MKPDDNAVERMARAMFACDHDESWEQAEELTRRIYLVNALAVCAASLRARKESRDDA